MPTKEDEEPERDESGMDPDDSRVYFGFKFNKSIRQWTREEKIWVSLNLRGNLSYSDDITDLKVMKVYPYRRKLETWHVQAQDVMW